MLMENNSNLTGKFGVFKLVTGEEIIARVVEDNHSLGFYKIKEPLSMVMVPQEDGQQGMVAFAPWILGAKDNAVIKLLETKIMVATEARDDAGRQYEQVMGIEPPATNKVAPQETVASRGRR